MKRNGVQLTQEEANLLFQNKDDLYRVEQENISLKNYKERCKTLEIETQYCVSLTS
jgi:hypothetical protein